MAGGVVRGCSISLAGCSSTAFSGVVGCKRLDLGLINPGQGPCSVADGTQSANKDYFNRSRIYEDDHYA